MHLTEYRAMNVPFLMIPTNRSNYLIQQRIVRKCRVVFVEGRIGNCQDFLRVVK